MFNMISKLRDELRLPAAAKAERRRDAKGLPKNDPDIDRFLDEGAAWLCRAQDQSSFADGGVARHYSLINRWVSSYPETTGYIVTTMIDYAKLRGNQEYRDRARRMLDWLVSIQLPNGGFQGGCIDSQPVVPVTFNTGQILLGLAAGMNEFGAYEQALQRAGDWLVATQDDDGCWRRFPTPFAKPGEKSYETHVSWGLFEAERLMPKRGYGEAGLKQVRWALTWQQENGWIDHCCIEDPTRPLTHTLGYALRGIVEAYRFSGDRLFLNAARRTADGLLNSLDEDGYLPGRLKSDWKPAVKWACLTGTVQIAHSLLMIYEMTQRKESVYRDAGFRANSYVRRTMCVDGPSGVRGGIKGSFPINGSYGKYEYLNWAVKFAIDSNMLEQKVRERMSTVV